MLRLTYVHYSTCVGQGRCSTAIPSVFDGKLSLWESACRLVHDRPHLARSHCLHEEENAVRVLFMSMASKQGLYLVLFSDR